MNPNSSNNTHKRPFPSAEDAFKRVELLPSGERQFKPLREKQNENEEFKSLPSYYTGKYKSSKITEEDAKTIRKENRILIEGSNPPKPILSFDDLGLSNSIMQLLYSHQIFVFYRENSIYSIVSNRNPNAIDTMHMFWS